MGDPQNHEENSRKPNSSFLGGLPSYGSYRPAGYDLSEAQLYVCEECGRTSRRVRTYKLLTVAFALFVLFWRDDTLQKCPRCIRRHILVRLPLAILLANIACP